MVMSVILRVLPGVGLAILCLGIAGCESGSSPSTDPGASTDVPEDIAGNLDAVVSDSDAPQTLDTGHDDSMEDAAEPGDTGHDVPIDSEVAPFEVPEFLGGDRPAAVHVPSYFDPAKAWPAIVVLHGYGASGLLQSAYLGLYDSVESHGHILIAPDGTQNTDGYPFWNAGPACCDFENSHVDDVGYISGLIREALERLPIDPARVSLIGHSNGGFMALRMACDEAGLLSGIVSIAGSMPESLACTPARPVSVLLVHGTRDTSIDYEGGLIRRVPYLGAEDLAASWAARNGCATGPVTDDKTLDYDSNIPGNETTATEWSECPGNANVVLWRMDDSTHAPVFNEDFKTAVIDLMLGW
jgi:polyhydroxybutyrate depolymerase